MRSAVQSTLLLKVHKSTVGSWDNVFGGDSARLVAPYGHISTGRSVVLTSSRGRREGTHTAVLAGVPGGYCCTSMARILLYYYYYSYYYF
eukprot:1439050-Rhodomonas_salina.1